MKKIYYVLFTAVMAFGMLISTAYAASNSDNAYSTQQQKDELTIGCGAIYNVAVYELKQGSGTLTIKKTINAEYDDETDEIIINGYRYRWTNNPYYGKSEYGKAAHYKYIVAGKYYFNWEYQGNGRFREEL
ncbi:MAG: hypothetical protein MJ000_01605 [Bacteroidales bacterium]|nr:hypothetical protein [Bacteroidales bacterium]